MKAVNTAETYGETINSLSILAYHKYLALVTPINILLNIYIYIYIYICVCVCVYSVYVCLRFAPCGRRRWEFLETQGEIFFVDKDPTEDRNIQ